MKILVEVVYVNIFRATEAPIDLLETFLANNEGIKIETLLGSGYVVEVNEKIIACFALEEISGNRLWLKQLYITKKEATILPLLLETILTLAKEKKAKVVCVNSVQPMVDVILAALEFHEQENKVLEQETDLTSGKWWTYNVS